jgi:hypothetical protein
MVAQFTRKEIGFGWFLIRLLRRCAGMVLSLPYPRACAPSFTEEYLRLLGGPNAE